jgi:hypothetical protein
MRKLRIHQIFAPSRRTEILMTDSTDTLETLVELDPAPRIPLAPYEVTRRDQLLREVLASDPEIRGSAVASDRAKRTSSGRGWRIAVPSLLAAAVVVAGVAVAAPHFANRFAPAAPQAAGPLSSISLASWTNDPKALVLSSPVGEAAKQWCVSSSAGGPAPTSTSTITNADLRGSVASMIVNRGGYAILCIVGSDDEGFWEVDGSPSDAPSGLAVDAIDIESAGSHGDGPTGLTYVEGRVGSSVRGITVTDAGKTFAATVEDGRWTAWWPTADPHGTVTGTITITAADGGTHTVSGASLTK